MQLTDICRQAVRMGASDIHLKVALPPLVRVDGELAPLPKAPPLTAKEVGEMAWNVMTPPQREQFKLTHDLDFAFSLDGIARFRANAFRARQAIGLVLRVIPDQVRTIAELGLPAALETIAALPRGLVLVTGATGSGKSTTLAAMVEHVNRTRRGHVLTIEDPIEFQFTDRRCVVNQREVPTDSRSFAIALRAAIRQDPDVILVGELRDEETTTIALRAAETGHLVLSTLHTVDAPDTINRLVGFFPPYQHNDLRHQLAANLGAIVSMRLIPRVSGGRIAAVEVMVNRGSITDCLADPSRVREILDHMARGFTPHGMQTFDQAVYRLIKSGAVSLREGLRHANNPDEVQLRLSGIGEEV